MKHELSLAGIKKYVLARESARCFRARNGKIHVEPLLDRYCDERAYNVSSPGDQMFQLRSAHRI